MKSGNMSQKNVNKNTFLCFADFTLYKGGGKVSFDIISNVAWRMSISGDVSNWDSIRIGNRPTLSGFSNHIPDISGNNDAEVIVFLKKLMMDENKVSWLFIKCEDDSLNKTRPGGESIKITIKQNPQ